jgi:hypothetical protein
MERSPSTPASTSQGFRRDQIDILMHAQFLSGLERRVRPLYASEAIDISFLDIIAAIEVKNAG